MRSFGAGCVRPEHRANAFAMAFATFGLAMLIGPITGSIIAHYSSPRIVFLAAFACVVINLVYIFIFLPESPLPPIAAGQPMGIADVSWSRVGNRCLFA